MESLTAFLTGSVFGEIAGLLMLGAAAGFVALMLRQPLIVGLLAAGILAGPSLTGLARSDAHIELLAELGIAVLLFLVGLKLDLRLIRSLGAVSLATGLGQVAFTAGFGFLIGLGLGLDALTSLYVAVALTFSSTIIIVKLLSDKREIDSLHGRIALGFLIVQDIVVVLAMVVVSALAAGAGQASAMAGLMRAILGGGAMLLMVGLFIRFVAGPLTQRLARSPELLAGFAIGWAALLAAIAHEVGLGKELGGLLAGVSLASTAFRDAIAARLATLRDFLLLFFFIGLGARLDLGVLGEQVWPAVVFSVFVLVGNPLIVVAIMGAMGYRRRTGFLAGLTVAQISEFSLVFMAMGVALGHVAEDSLGLVTLVGMVTIAMSTYMIVHSHRLAEWCDPLLRPFERSNPWREAAHAPAAAGGADVVVMGLGRYGSVIARRLEERGLRVLGVDFDPEALRRRRAAGLEAVYGDASDPEFIAHLPLSGTSWIVSAIPPGAGGLTHEDHRVALLDALRERNFAGKVAVVAHGPAEAEALRARGADLVLMPFHDAAQQAAELIDASLPRDA
ncbi:cation:proton antiporter [Roseomonas alkaliterrae]|uniref:Kef-type K+ transport system membrane component KefB n=1 Tax=Neoroseomonas alkaliterrae TaxID=1452450 RepID=A0A840YCG4_9PROT|nr:cation:proton antiporter family protein [Neoroseomonas alkaliterrae]MBB5691584.1 Kef-type K+ transport system membrane component KefB [Neoroseomonas alkaliterrae]MBR0676769.1 cation:proton antiporter [Neoroseomonas alkaliterrae]